MPEAGPAIMEATFTQTESNGGDSAQEHAEVFGPVQGFTPLENEGEVVAEVPPRHVFQKMNEKAAALHNALQAAEQVTPLQGVQVEEQASAALPLQEFIPPSPDVQAEMAERGTSATEPVDIDPEEQIRAAQELLRGYQDLSPQQQQKRSAEIAQTMRFTPEEVHEVHAAIQEAQIEAEQESKVSFNLKEFWDKIMNWFKGLLSKKQ